MVSLNQSAYIVQHTMCVLKRFAPTHTRNCTKQFMKNGTLSTWRTALFQMAGRTI